MTKHGVIDVLALVRVTFPGARLTRQRTPELFARYWSELGQLSDERKHAESIAAVRLERLQEQRRQTPVARRP